MNPETSPERVAAERLSILHLMVWSIGVAVSLALIQGIEYLNHIAYTKQLQLLNINEAVPEYRFYVRLDRIAISVAYGTAVALAWFAIRSNDFRQVAGKLIISLIAFMAIFDRGLTAIAACYVLVFESISVYGIYYGNLAPTIGYFVGIAACLWICVFARAPRYWLACWIALAVASLLLTARFSFGAKLPIPGMRGDFNFLLIMFFPVITSMVGLICDVVTRRIQWWTVVAVSLLTTMWISLLIIALR